MQLPTNPFISKLKAYRKFNEDELEVLRQLSSEGVREFNKGFSPLKQGHTYQGTFILLDGWAMRYSNTLGGKRQIINFILPGDVIGLRACVSRTPIYSVTLLTDARLASFVSDRILNLFVGFPHIAAALFWYSGQEFELLVRRFSALGTGSAAERIVHLLLELWHRLRLVGLTQNHSYPFPLTQEHIAQSLGLSVVHVNRTLKVLQNKYHVTLVGQRVDLPDPVELSRAVGVYDLQNG